MKAHLYAQALYAAADGKDDAALERIAVRMREILEARRQTRLLPRILHELERIVRERHQSAGSEVRVAHKDDAARHGARITQDLQKLGGNDVADRLVEDTTIIGGYEVRVRGKRIDRTHKRALVDMFNTLIIR